MKPPYSEPAFPSQSYGQDGLPNSYAEYGMSQRDYFAGQAIDGLCAISDRSGTWTMDPQEAVDAAFKVADLMMARRLEQ